MNPEQFHLHKRKRKTKVDDKVRFIDNMVSVVSVVFPLSTLPQVYNIWILGKVEGVSIFTWGIYLVLQIPLLIYSIIHKDRRLQVMFWMWLLMYILVISGLLLH